MKAVVDRWLKNSSTINNDTGIIRHMTVRTESDVTETEYIYYTLEDVQN